MDTFHILARKAQLIRHILISMNVFGTSVGHLSCIHSFIALLFPLLLFLVVLFPFQVHNSLSYYRCYYCLFARHISRFFFGVSMPYTLSSFHPFILSPISITTHHIPTYHRILIHHHIITPFLSSLIRQSITPSLSASSPPLLLLSSSLLITHPSPSGRCAGVLCGRVCGGVGGVDAGDHPPITPQRDGVGLSGKAAALYTLICRYFLASISQNATIEKSKAVFKIAGEQFVSKSVRVISGGFKDILGDSAKLNVCTALALYQRFFS